MPRSGVTGTYTLPPGTDNQVAGTPISPTMFNAFADDVEQGFNTPTPIAYGGTNAATASDARNNLESVGFTTQTLTSAQQQQARTNIGMEYGFPFLHVVDQKNPGIEGGSSSVGSQVRTLNTIVTNRISGATLSANSVFLPEGTYYAEASAPAFISGSHKIELLLGGLALAGGSGTSEFNNTTDAVQTRSQAACQFAVASGGQSLVVLHRFTTARATNGLGVGANFGAGINEIYAELRVWKLR